MTGPKNYPTRGTLDLLQSGPRPTQKCENINNCRQNWDIEKFMFISKYIGIVGIEYQC